MVTFLGGPGLGPTGDAAAGDGEDPVPEDGADGIVTAPDSTLAAGIVLSFRSALGWG